MRRTIVASACAALLGAACATEPDHLQMEPKAHVFKRVGEDLWWKAMAVNKQGRALPKLTAMTWKTSDPQVATVDAVGRVKAVGPGHATVTARLGKLSADAEIDVEVVEGVAVEPAELSLKAWGESKSIAIRVLGPNGRELKGRMPVARCLDEDVCRATGVEVHPVDPGKTTLVVSAEGKKAEIPVTVTGAKRR